MDFYSRLFAGQLGGDGSGGDENFKLAVSGDLTTVNAKMLDGVTNIGNYAFYSCGLTSIEIPGSVTSIGSDAFEYCRSLTSVTVLSTTPPTLGSYAFSSTHSNLKIYVPAESVDAYKAATNWSSYKSKIQAIPA